MLEENARLEGAKEMRSHELARVLLAEPDAEVAISAMGHDYLSDYHRASHGGLQLATLEVPRQSGESAFYIAIGHMLRGRSTVGTSFRFLNARDIESDR